jgi:hypothetical protein
MDRRTGDADMIKIESRIDAQTFVYNSGVAEWEWGGNASAEGFALWLRANRDSVDRDDYDNELREYLISVGEDPADYSL